MALGGGTFVTQNKELPGAYINFISAASANAALSERGIATMPLELDWGVDNIFRNFFHSIRSRHLVNEQIIVHKEVQHPIHYFIFHLISEQEIQNIAPKVLESKIKKFLGECLQ